MPAPLIKICGISTVETLEAAIAARADFAGLMFYAPSPRVVSAEQAARLAEQAGSRIGRVGVFVDPDDDLLGDAVAAGRLDAIQLHRVSAARRAEVRQRFGLPIWAVLEVAGPGDLAALGHYDSFDRLIYDAKTPRNALPGGMGLSFDWTMLRAARHPGPWGLAGGLSAANVAEAVRITGAPLLDVSSGVETAPGVKDVDLIAAFCQAARL
ncbi:phosphoribosylanthranilate isomerase [Novosphingobium aquiterrae]|uniref:N-(5'-phosphoribosyl)anthranilate isomerase n=1 Tax=Novosphingobium aquiterrae TaxID=624388 RepID=A0ABV6PG41_9SPHN